MSQAPPSAGPPSSGFRAQLTAFLRSWRIWQVIVLAFLFVGGCGFYTAAGLLFVIGPRGGPKPEPPYEFVYDSDEWHFKFTSKSKDWQQEVPGVERDLKPVLVMRRRDPNSTFVISAQEVKGQKLDDDTKLRDFTIEWLKKGIQGLKTGRWRETKIDGKDARRLDIQGDDANGDFLSGECSLLVQDGKAYLLVVWRPRGAKVSDEEWTELRKGFTLEQ
jgi:hypothetical protein